MNPTTLHKWLAKYHYSCIEVLKIKRQPGRPPKLSGEQLQWLTNTVRENNPLHRAYQQDPVLVERWRTEDYPQIQRQAKKDNALIFFADESGIRSDYHKGHTWAEQGEMPVVQANRCALFAEYALGGEPARPVPLHAA